MLKLQESIKRIIKNYKYKDIVPIILAVDMIPNNTIPYAGVSGLKMYYNKESIEKLTDKQIDFLLLHEMMHIACKHELIYNSEFKSNPLKTNMACDYWINYELLKDNSLEFIDGGLYNEKYKDMTIIQIYNLLESDENYKHLSINPDNMLEENSDEYHKISVGIDSLLKSAQQGNLAEKIKQGSTKKIDWTKILTKHFVKNAKFGNTNKTWKSPNKKIYSSTGIYIPSSVNKKLQDFIIAIDVSGSIDIELCEKFLYHCSSLKKQFNSKINVVTFSDNIMNEYKDYQYGDEIEYNGGGTSINPVINYINNSNSKFGIVFTDGMFYEQVIDKSKKNIIWASTERKEYDYGDVVFLEK